MLGAVNAPMSVTYVPGKGLGYYVNAAGGLHREADEKRTFVTQPNGKVESVRKHWWFIPDSRPDPLPGSTVFVPTKDPNDRKDWLGIVGSVAQILASLTTVIVVVLRTK